MREIKSADNINIYPFDKGSGFVSLSNKESLRRIEIKIGTTKTTD